MSGTLIVVTGPTAVGKTELCLEIANKYHKPVINADSRQMYKGMEIGTAAPTAQQLKAVEHYFVGNLQPTAYYSAAMFEHDVLNLLDCLFGKEVPTASSEPDTTQTRIALMSGGSMMYIDAVCNGIDDIPTITPETRNILKERLAAEGLEKLCEELKALDPEYYGIVDKKNPRRVIHGLEICLQTGKPYSSFRKKSKKQRNFKIIKIGLNRPREELYTRINARVDKMMSQGLLDEVKTLYPLRAHNALNTVGYKELFAYIDGTYTYEEAIERIKGNTRRYARKQLTWLKKDKDIVWFSPNDKDAIMNYISQHE